MKCQLLVIIKAVLMVCETSVGNLFFSEEKSPFRTARIFVEKNALKPGVVTLALGAERAFLTWPS